MDEVVKKYEDKSKAQKISRVLLNARIAWFVFLFIVANPLIKSVINSSFTWDGIISIDYVSRQTLLFILVLFSLGTGFLTPTIIDKLRLRSDHLTRLFISFTFQCGFFLSVPVLGFVIAMEEGNPSLVFLYSIIGVLLLASNYPTRTRWALPDKDTAHAFESEDDLVSKRKNNKIFMVIWSVILLSFSLKMGYSFLQSQKKNLATAEQCHQDCLSLFTNGELQPGVTTEMCIEKSCK
jgi:hypothetical protein